MFASVTLVSRAALRLLVELTVGFTRAVSTVNGPEPGPVKFAIARASEDGPLCR